MKRTGVIESESYAPVDAIYERYKIIGHGKDGAQKRVPVSSHNDKRGGKCDFLSNLYPKMWECEGWRHLLDGPLHLGS